MSNQTVKRKSEHIDIVLKEEASYPNQCIDIYNGIRVVHRAFPGIGYNDIDTSIEFLGYKLKAPLMITGITGGNTSVRDVNEKLAVIAEEYGLAIGVGSQRAMLENKDRDILESYLIVRRIAENVPVIGNIGLNTLRDYSVKEVADLVDTLEADALAIHLNPGQELIQPEGDTFFSSELLGKLEELVDTLSKPVIIKEVGTGLSMEDVELFSSIGIKIFDVAGACGTNWFLV